MYSNRTSPNSIQGSGTVSLPGAGPRLDQGYYPVSVVPKSISLQGNPNPTTFNLAQNRSPTSNGQEIGVNLPAPSSLNPITNKPGQRIVQAP